MKFIYFIVFILIVLILSSLISVDFRDRILFWFDAEDKYLSKSERLVNQILYETSSSITKKYKIAVIGTIVSMPEGKIKRLGLDFSSYQNLSKDQLRKFLIEFAEMLLHNVTSNEEIQYSLENKPFTIENIQMAIYNHDHEGYWVYDPEIGIGEIRRGILTYVTHNPERKNQKTYKYFKSMHEYEETYAEALQILHEKM